MPISVIPKFLQKAFAATGAKTDIPLNADLINGRAGYNEGFPPINMTSVAAGGIPPYGQDMNGILYDLSAAIQYAQSGMRFPFDAAFATAIGGYGVGAVVSDPTDKSLLWINGTASNTAFPTGWTQFSLKKSNETIQGTIRVGTKTEVNAGALDDVAVTPNKLRAGFSALLSSNGFIALPSWLGGIVLQWGQVGGFSSYELSFPMAFASSPFFNPIAICNGTGGADIATAAFVETSFVSNSKFRAFMYRPGDTGGVISAPRGISWFCIGK